MYRRPPSLEKIDFFLREGGLLYTGYLDCFGYQLTSQMLRIELLSARLIKHWVDFYSAVYSKMSGVIVRK